MGLDNTWDKCDVAGELVYTGSILLSVVQDKILRNSCENRFKN